jgi:hypothetical protein
MASADEQYDEKMQGHLDDALENIQTIDEIICVHRTTDKAIFSNFKEAIKHQYKIERGAI